VGLPEQGVRFFYFRYLSLFPERTNYEANGKTAEIGPPPSFGFGSTPDRIQRYTKVLGGRTFEVNSPKTLSAGITGMLRDIRTTPPDNVSPIRVDPASLVDTLLAKEIFQIPDLVPQPIKLVRQSLNLNFSPPINVIIQLAS
jgi:hypothetical protein